MTTEPHDEHNKELEQVVTALANHGVAARSVSGGIFLSLAVAKNLVSLLEDLKQIEERGSV